MKPYELGPALIGRMASLEGEERVPVRTQEEGRGL